MAVTRSKAQPARTTAAPVTKPQAGKVVGGTPESEEVVGAGGSLASVFDGTPPAASGGGIKLPPGKYECIIVGAAILDAEASGRQAARVKVEVCDEGDHQGETVDLYYNLIDKEGKASAGIGFLKRDLEKLGYPEIKFADIPEAFQQLEAAMDGVEILVKLNPPYVNAYLQSLLEGSEIVANWKQVRPPTPY